VAFGTGTVGGAWTQRQPQAQQALMSDIVRWCGEGKLSAHVHAVYPLAEIATAPAVVGRAAAAAIKLVNSPGSFGR
jgi:NADPH2:quinone reductase